MKVLNEMTIGRTDDPENPSHATACKAATVFGTGSRVPSGPAVMQPHQQAGHMIAIDPSVGILNLVLASKGSSTHAWGVVRILCGSPLRRSQRAPKQKPVTGPPHGARGSSRGCRTMRFLRVGCGLGWWLVSSSIPTQTAFSRQSLPATARDAMTQGRDGVVRKSAARDRAAFAKGDAPHLARDLVQAMPRCPRRGTQQQMG